MKLSEFIEALQDVRQEHGDMPVSFFFEPVDSLSVIIETVVGMPHDATVIICPIHETER